MDLRRNRLGNWLANKKMGVFGALLIDDGVGGLRYGFERTWAARLYYNRSKEPNPLPEQVL